jgi:hypothetical protein
VICLKSDCEGDCWPQAGLLARAHRELVLVASNLQRKPSLLATGRGNPAEEILPTLFLSQARPLRTASVIKEPLDRAASALVLGVSEERVRVDIIVISKQALRGSRRPRGRRARRWRGRRRLVRWGIHGREGGLRWRDRRRWRFARWRGGFCGSGCGGGGSGRFRGRACGVGRR